MNKETTWLLKEKYHDVETDAFFADCKRLEAGEPLAYIIGSIPFLNCQISLDSHPLIPRPETEHWTEQAITTIKNQSSRSFLELEEVRVPASNLDLPTKELGRQDLPGGGLASSLKVLDLCAGSGAIGVAVAKAVPEVLVTFVELDSAHLPTIEKNITLNTTKNNQAEITTIFVSDKYKVLQSDLFTSIPVDTKFDFILSNPPYIDEQANTVEESVTLHEPHLALFGGEAGMELIARIIAGAKHYLTPQGQLWIEHEPVQVEAIAKLAKENGFTVVTHLDQYRVPRVSVLTVAQ